MKNKRIFHVIIFILFSIQVHAQIDKEIIAFVDSTEILVNNGRKLLLQKIGANDYEKVREIYNYLTYKTLNNDYSAFEYTEDLYINMLIRDWNKLTELLSDYKKGINKKGFPGSYKIFPVLYDNVAELSDYLTRECLNSDLDDESKRMIELILHLIKSGKVDMEYNSILSDFYRNYKTTKYNDFLKSYLPGEKIRGSFCISMGSGMVITTNKLAENFPSNASFNMSMDFNVQKIYSSLYLQGSGLRLKEPFTVTSGFDSLTFKSDESFSYLDFGLKGGYFIIRNNRFHLAPYVSVSGSFLESTRFETKYDGDEYKIFNSFTYGGGVHTETKIREFMHTSWYAYPLGSFISLKLETGYNFIAKFKDDFFKGNMPYFTIAFVWGFGDF